MGDASDASAPMLASSVRGVSTGADRHGAHASQSRHKRDDRRGDQCPWQRANHNRPWRGHCGRRRRLRSGHLERALQHEPHVADVTHALLRVLSQAHTECLTDSCRYRGRERVEIRFALDDAGQRNRHVFAAKCTVARQHLVDHAAKGPDVGPFVHGLAARLLWAHIGRCAENDADTRISLVP